MRRSRSLALALLASTPATVWATPPSRPDVDDLLEEGRDAVDDAESTGLRRLSRAAEVSPKVPIRLSLLGWTGWAGGASERGVGAMLIVPVDLLSLRGADSTRLVRAAGGGDPASIPALAESGAPTTEEVTALPSRELRRLVRAAWRSAGLSPDDPRLSDMASRARASAALPELRLKVVRTVDQSLRLTPTDADPYRVQTGDGAGMLYEARATWRLDRLVFADDEVALERLRVERNEQRLKLTLHVIESVAAWQKAHARSLDPTAAPGERADALVKEIVAAAALDALTDGAWSLREESKR